ncbi:hypothetical protein DXG01_010134 [Tephrocybe rancida]|nr:hypothetical protein DXG01_010134 [Tephrocybe rancida]
MERGAYRMRAPYSKSRVRSLQFSAQLDRRNERGNHRSPSNLAMLVAFLTFASISSFAMAYYLFSSRWDARQLARPSSTDETQGVPVDLSQDDPLDPEEKFLGYLPHSGFHNQRIAFENALVLSRLTNRTLLVPPVYLGKKPIHYVPFNTLYLELAQANKVGLQHCSRVRSYPLPLECTDYFDQTQIPWDWLVDIGHVKHNQRLRQRWNFSESWVYEHLNISKLDILFIRDNIPYQYRFLDAQSNIPPAHHKFSENIHISDLVMSSKRLIQIGTLFGSSRLHLRDSDNVAIRGHIRETMSFTHPALLDAASSIANSLGPFYIGVHLRLGDGRFKNHGKSHTRKAWWRVVHGILAYTEEEASALEHDFVGRFQEVPPDIQDFGDVPHDLLHCRGRLHFKSHHLQLNTPIFISTDVDKRDPAFTGFWKTFPCVFFLSDFPAGTVALDDLRNPLDGVSLKHMFLPFLDALVVGHAWKVVGTENSTFSTFVQDVLWRKHHNLRIVQRG